MRGLTAMRQWLPAIVASLALACGGGGSGDGPPATCDTMGDSTWVGTENVTTTSGSCSSFTGLSLTFTIKQAAGSCNFTLVSSRVTGITFDGTISGDGLTWTHAPYAYDFGTLTLNSTAGTLSTDQQTLTGSFTWTLAFSSSQCKGTTTFNLVKQ